MSYLHRVAPLLLLALARCAPVGGESARDGALAADSAGAPRDPRGPAEVDAGVDAVSPPVADADAVDAAEDVATVAKPDFFGMELDALRARAIHAPPSVADVKALVAAGIPKPPDARAPKAHAALMGWSQDAMTLAFRLATDADAATAQGHAADLAAMLDFWVAYGTGFGDPKNDADYGNATLEMTWFMGNMARAARVLAAHAPAPVWTPAERAAFAKWAHAMGAAYVDFSVFSAGLSNRKASQIETLMRIAELDGAAGESAIQSLWASLEQLAVAAIQDRGDIPEDSGRDKYHPQFFLASALQGIELAARHGHRLDPLTEPGRTAQKHLAAALRYSAATNESAAPPAEYPTMTNAAPNYEIPFWVLAPGFFDAANEASTPAVAGMVAENYARPSRISFVMQWGFDAIARAKGL